MLWFPPLQDDQDEEGLPLTEDEPQEEEDMNEIEVNQSECICSSPVEWMGEEQIKKFTGHFPSWEDNLRRIALNIREISAKITKELRIAH